MLQLAALLAQPRELASALDSFLEGTNLKGLEYRGLRLTIVARYALRWNQVDGRWFESVWKPLVRGEEASEDWGIEGTSLDGLDGITAMPLELPALGWALVEIAGNWENDPERRAKRDELWERARSGSPAIDSDFLWRALTYDYPPDWLIETWCEPVIAGVQQYSGWSREKSASHVKGRVADPIFSDRNTRGRGWAFLADAALHGVPKSAGYPGHQQSIFQSMQANM